MRARRSVAALVVLVALVALAGWWLGWPLLQSVRPEWPTMKPVTALACLAVAWLLVRPASVVAAVAVIGLMSVSFVARLDAGHPSLGAVLALWCVVLASRWPRREIGLVAARAVVCLGASALVGFAVGVPHLYHYWAGVSNGMAITTAALLVAVGLVLTLDPREG